MNQNLLDTIIELEKADAVMFAIEKAYLDLEVLPEDLEKMNRLANAFYVLWEILKKAEKSLQELKGDIDVIAAIRNSKKES